MPTHPVPDGGFSQAAGLAGSQSASLPLTRSLTLAYASSLVIALLVAITSIAGLLYGRALYPTEEMLLAKLPTDLFTLVVGLPILLGSMWLARRGKLLGLLCWPGVLLYVLYIYVAYAIGVPFNVLFLAYVVLVALSAYTIIGLVASIDVSAIRQRLAGAVPERTAGGILVSLAILFTLMNLAAIVTALNSPTPGYLLEFPVWIADLAVVAPAWLIGGSLLWRRKALGYVLVQKQFWSLVAILRLICAPKCQVIDGQVLCGRRGAAAPGQHVVRRRHLCPGLPCLLCCFAD